MRAIAFVVLACFVLVVGACEDAVSEPEDAAFEPMTTLGGKADSSSGVGTPCSVGGQAGVCLSTSSCGGEAVPGHCPGPSSTQCCLQGCRVGAEDGACLSTSSCGGVSTAGLCPGPSGVQCCVDSGGAPPPVSSPGDFFSSMRGTFYYVSNEAAYSGPDTTTLFDDRCRPVAEVPAAFSDAACIEGTGRLEDGSIVNYESTCSCGRPCPTGGTVCWTRLDRTRFPWGKGNRGNALQPLRSLAVDTRQISNGTVLYLADWDGVAIPSIDGLGGFVHDGCFRADDVGGAIRGDRYDLFAGTPAMWRALEQKIPSMRPVQAYVNASRCDYLEQ